MDGASGLGLAGVEDGPMDVLAVHAFAAESGQQGGMDVDHPMLKVVGDHDQREEAGEDDEVDAGVAELGPDGVAEGLGVVELLAGDDVDGQAALTGAVDAGGIGVGGDDADDFGVERPSVDALGEIEHGRSAAADEHAEAEGSGWAELVGHRGGPWHRLDRRRGFISVVVTG